KNQLVLLCRVVLFRTSWRDQCRSPRAIGHTIATTVRPPVGPKVTWSVYVNHSVRDDPVVAAWGGHVVNLEGSTGPWKIVQLCSRRAACPRRFARRCGLRGGDHPLSE